MKAYDGFYALNPKTKNMMFFREEKTGRPYKLHAYMKLTEKKSNQLANTHELLNQIMNYLNKSRYFELVAKDKNLET